MVVPDFSDVNSKEVTMNTVMEIEGLYGFVGTQSGQIIALRNNGDQALFASKENTPLTWIDIEKFTPDPAGLLTPEESAKEEKEDEDF